MTNYSEDEEQRQRDKEIDILHQKYNEKKEKTMNLKNSVKLGQSTKHTYQLEIDDDQFLEIAKKAAKNNVTFNQMVNITLQKKLIDDYEYQFEHSPQLLNEG